MKNSLPILTKKTIVSKDSQLPVKPSWLETDLHYTHMVFYILPSKQNLWEMLSTVNLPKKCHSFLAIASSTKSPTTKQKILCPQVMFIQPLHLQQKKMMTSFSIGFMRSEERRVGK